MILHDKWHILINLHHLWRDQSAVSCFGQFWAGMARHVQTTHQVYFHHIPLMVLYQHAKNYQKRWSGSEDIQIWKIERSDWSRAFDPITRKPEFSQSYEWCPVMPHHTPLTFRSFPAKNDDSILRNCPKSPFLLILCPFLGKRESFRKIQQGHFYAFIVA